MKTPTTASNNGNNASFVNHALTLWTERGQECAGSQQHSRPQESGEPLISWSANDDELLVPNRPFPQSNHLPNLFAQESQNNGGNPWSQVRGGRGPDSSAPVYSEEPSKTFAQYIAPPFSPSNAGTPSLFSPVHLFSPQCSLPYNVSGFNWQVGNSQSVLPGHQTFLQGFAPSTEQAVIVSTSSQVPVLPGEGILYREKAGDRDGTSDLSLGDDESSDSDESSKEELHHSTHGREKAGKRRHSGKEKWRRHKGSRKGDMKRELSKEYLRNENSKDVMHSHMNIFKEGEKRIKRKKREDSMDCELSGSSSESGSSSSESDKVKKEVVYKKRRRAGQDADGNVTWTDESVRFLFETYDSIHRRLWEESNGQVKYQKKWTPILKAMQERFGSHFSKKQCQSKYWSVRRECSDYRYMSAKIARSDPSWNPSIAGRELLKPKFYDVWFEVSGKNQAVTPKGGTLSEAHVGQAVKNPAINLRSSRLLGKEVPSSMHSVNDCGNAVKEMQRLMKVQLQSSERREEAMKYRAELMMELLTQHMEHVEKRVGDLEEGRQPQLYALERVNLKLEKVLEGFSALNENLSTIAYGITKGLKA